MKETQNRKFCRQTFHVYFLNHSLEMAKKKTRTVTCTKFLLIALTPSRFEADQDFTFFSHHRNLTISSEGTDSTTTHANAFQDT